MTGARRLILDRIEEAAKRGGRSPEEIKLIAVSKTQSERAVRELASQGQVDFAENYVQEFLQKRAALDQETLRWHFIGRLQKNKINQLLGKCHRIHSIESAAQLQALEQRAAAAGTVENTLLQINLSSEHSKGGFDEESFLQAIPSLDALKAVRVRGLMTMPPPTMEGEDNRIYFRRLRELATSARVLVNQEVHPLDELSMGTSQDFEIAVEEGASWIRVGTLIFGPRSTAGA